MAKKRSKHARSKRKHQHAPKGNVVWKQTAKEATLASKPYINAYACGHGVQGDTKYNRTKEKRAWKRDLQEGASRGSFLYLAKRSPSTMSSNAAAHLRVNLRTSTYDHYAIDSKTDALDLDVTLSPTIHLGGEPWTTRTHTRTRKTG